MQSPDIPPLSTRSVFYYLRVVTAMYFREEQGGEAYSSWANAVVLAVLVLGLGIVPAPFMTRRLVLNGGPSPGGARSPGREAPRRANTGRIQPTSNEADGARSPPKATGAV